MESGIIYGAYDRVFTEEENEKAGANMVRLVHSFHQRWHVLFENKTPHEQLDLWYDLNLQVLETPVREKVENILSDGEYIYKNCILRPHE